MDTIYHLTEAKTRVEHGEYKEAVVELLQVVEELNNLVTPKMMTSKEYITINDEVDNIEAIITARKYKTE